MQGRKDGRKVGSSLWCPIPPPRVRTAERGKRGAGTEPRSFPSTRCLDRGEKRGERKSGGGFALLPPPATTATAAEGGGVKWRRPRRGGAGSATAAAPQMEAGAVAPPRARGGAGARRGCRRFLPPPPPPCPSARRSQDQQGLVFLKGGCLGDAARLFTVVPSDRTEEVVIKSNTTGSS